MKKVLNIFAKSGEENNRGRSRNYGYREPILYPVGKAAHPSGPAAPATADHDSRTDEPEQKNANVRKETRYEIMDIPSDYAGIVSFFHKIVSDRKSPFNSLVQASERLQDYIPDDISRLKAAYALCGEQWLPEALALAISHHITDIDNACGKAKNSKRLYTTERIQQIKRESETLKRQNAKLHAEMELLKKSLAQLQEKFDATQTKIDSLDEQACLVEGDANSVGLLEQAAENLKNDLLAKKVLLGLTI